MRSLFVALAMLGGLVTAAFAADPVGTYKVQGTNPNGGSYTGTVTVTKTGQTYQVVWEIGDTQFEGTAIGNKDFMAVTYHSGDNTGLALYGEDGGNWRGLWTYAGGTKIASENWKRE